MYFCHSTEIWRDYPELAAGVLFVEGITPNASVAPRVAAFQAKAASRLAKGSEGELVEIQAWRRAFSKMGLKPTQYRCASEALLRRFRKEGTLPQIHPLIDLCNAISLAFAIPIAVFDCARITASIEVRSATGSERYLAFSGDEEQPEPGEVIFADAAGHAHARRWTNRQSRMSAVGADTTAALIVAEAMHGSGVADVQRLTDAVAEELTLAWSARPQVRVLTKDGARFEFGL